MAKIHVPALIGKALEDVLSEVAANGNWRDRRKTEWLLAKLESCISRNDELARLREPFTPAGIMSGNARDLRFYLYDRHRAGPWRRRIWGSGIRGQPREEAMRTTVRTEAEAVRASVRKLLKTDWYDGLITSAIEKVAERSGNDTIELTVEVGDRTLRDWLSDADRGSLKLRHCCQACGDEVFERYTAGQVDQSDFPGHRVQVRVGIQKGNRAFPGDRNVIEDYRAAPDDSRVVNLRAG